MESQTCPICKTDKYKNPSLRIMVNVCGHVLCENCMKTLFVKGSGACPQCGVVLILKNFRVQQFEDPLVEKDVDIRRKILAIYNKSEEEFPTSRDYDDYVESVEWIIYNLVHNIDAEATQAKVEKYRKENKESIAKNRCKPNKELLEYEHLLERENKQKSHFDRERDRAEVEEKRRKLKEKEEFIRELAHSNDSAKDILHFYAEKRKFQKEEKDDELMEEKLEMPGLKKFSHFSTGVKIGEKFSMMMPVVREGPLYVYQEPQVALEGPPVPTWEELREKGYLKYIKEATAIERAGGYDPIYPCMKALQEAMDGLYNTPES